MQFFSILLSLCDRQIDIKIMLNEVNKSTLMARVTKRGSWEGRDIVSHSADDDGDASDDVCNVSCIIANMWAAREAGAECDHGKM